MALETNFASILAGLSPFDRNVQFAQPGPYKTNLDSDQGNLFTQWLMSKAIPFSPIEANPDYDMQGFFKAMLAGDPHAVRSALNAHFTDQYKTPYHESFSRESQYAKPNAPRWQGNRLLDERGKVIFDATEHP